MLVLSLLMALSPFSSFQHKFASSSSSPASPSSSTACSSSSRDDDLASAPSSSSLSSSLVASSSSPSSSFATPIHNLSSHKRQRETNSDIVTTTPRTVPPAAAASLRPSHPSSSSSRSNVAADSSEYAVHSSLLFLFSFSFALFPLFLATPIHNLLLANDREIQAVTCTTQMTTPRTTPHAAAASRSSLISSHLIPHHLLLARLLLLIHPSMFCPSFLLLFYPLVKFAAGSNCLSPLSNCNEIESFGSIWHACGAIGALRKSIAIFLSSFRLPDCELFVSVCPIPAGSFSPPNIHPASLGSCFSFSSCQSDIIVVLSDRIIFSIEQFLFLPFRLVLRLCVCSSFPSPRSL